MRIGDASRRRRFADPVRMRWYAYHRCVRFSRRMLRLAACSIGFSAHLCSDSRSYSGCQ
jgi:hypothetical protein